MNKTLSISVLLGTAALMCGQTITTSYPSTFVSTVTIYSAPTPCTPDELAADAKRREANEARNKDTKSLVFITSTECDSHAFFAHGSVKMAEIVGDRVSVEPGFTAEQVIVRLLDLYTRDTQALSKYHQEQSELTGKAMGEYQSAVEKQISNYQALVTALKRENGALEKQNKRYSDQLESNIRAFKQIHELLNPPSKEPVR